MVKLREVAAKDVGGEIIWARMIGEGRAFCYMCNGHQYVRMGEHKWDDTTGLEVLGTFNGTSEGKNALGNMTIEPISDCFFTALEDAHHEKNCIFGHQRLTCHARTR